MKQIGIWPKQHGTTSTRIPLGAIAAVALTALWLTAILKIQYPGPQGGDFYQIWLGARALLSGDNPYGSAVQQEMHRAYGYWGQHGLPYPLPALLATVPFAMLPLPIATWLWMGLCLATMCMVIALRPNWRQQYGIPLLFLPLIRTTGLLQPTLMWVALSVLLILALQRRWPVLAGLCFALLPAKPQTGLIIACAGVLWSLRYQRAAVVWGAIWFVGIWGSAFLLAPNWVQDCLTSIVRYRALYSSLSFLPLGLVVAVAAYRQPWWAAAAGLQVIAFPIHDMYGTLPLLIAWVGIGGPVAWIGAGLSWMWIFIDDLDFVSRIWLCFLLPYIMAALWQTRTAWLPDSRTTWILNTLKR